VCFVILLLSWPGFYKSNVRNVLQNGVTQLIHLHESSGKCPVRGLARSMGFSAGFTVPKVQRRAQ